jgi:hypothetical protein
MMAVFVRQTFEIKQDKFKEGLENLQEVKKYRNENYNHTVEILAPVSGEGHRYDILSKFEDLAEMELQYKKMAEDDEYNELIDEFTLEIIKQGSMKTQLLRTMSNKSDKSDKSDKKKKG